MADDELKLHRAAPRASPITGRSLASIGCGDRAGDEHLTVLAVALAVIGEGLSNQLHTVPVAAPRHRHRSDPAWRP